MKRRDTRRSPAAQGPGIAQNAVAGVGFSQDRTTPVQRRYVVPFAEDGQLGHLVVTASTMLGAVRTRNAIVAIRARAGSL